ncbi:MAG: hypothetical protein GDA44_05235 [Prochloron sp. SP5CPC1]|nr:hypothetical protein [Candidatus Paraprochloron terpiosi SP5CPC1]
MNNELNNCPINTQICLSIATSPFLFSFIALESLTHTLIKVGHSAEEIFRGDRLPVLPSPDWQKMIL